MTANEELRPGLLGLESSTGFQSLNTIIGRQTHNQLILHMHFIGPFVYKHCGSISSFLILTSTSGLTLFHCLLLEGNQSGPCTDEAAGTNPCDVNVSSS